MRRNLDGKSMVDQAIAILRTYEPPEGYYLAFSGGKDSVVLYRLAQMAGVRFDAHYSVCPDPPELMRFIKREYPAVAWDRPEHTLYWYIERKGFPTRRRRWCCELFKEAGGRGRVVLTGIRAAESPARQRRGTVEWCYRHRDKLYVNPILGWSTGEVWEFIRSQGLPYCHLYDEGWHRLGCVPCPFERKVERSMGRWPRIWENCRRAFRRGWERCGENGHHGFRESHRRFESADAVFEWWCSRDRPYPAPLDEEDEQPALFV